MFHAIVITTVDNHSPLRPEARDAVMLLPILCVLRGDAADEWIGCKKNNNIHQLVHIVVVPNCKSKPTNKTSPAYLDYSL